VVGDVGVVGYRRPAVLLDQLDDIVGVPARSLPAHGGAEVVHDHCGTVPGELKGMASADAVGGAGHDGDLVREQTGHHYLLGGFHERMSRTIASRCSSSVGAGVVAAGGASPTTRTGNGNWSATSTAAGCHGIRSRNCGSRAT